MASIFEQIFNLLVDPSGSMVYQLVIAFTFISVLQPVLSFIPIEHKTQRKRAMIGILALIASRLILFLFALLSILDIEFITKTLPVLEKAINTLDIAIIVWLFAFQKGNKAGDIGLALFGLSILAGGVISMLFWGIQTTGAAFNQSLLAFGWGAATLIVLMIGIITLIRSKSSAGSTGIIMLGVLILTEGLQLVFPPSAGSYFPLSRLGHLIAFPLLVGILQNFQINLETTEDETEPLDEPVDFAFSEFPDDEQTEANLDAVDLTEESEEADEDSETAHTPLTKSMPLHIYQNAVAMGGATNAHEICQLFTRFTAHALLSDLCLLLTPPDNNGQVHLVCGYDLIVQETLEGTSFDFSYIPRYKKIMKTARPIHVMDQGAEKMHDFANLLQVDEIGNLLAYPVLNTDREVIAVVVLISPYSKRIWNADDQEYLKNAITPITQLIQRATTPIKDEKSIQSLTEELELSETGKQEIEEENQRLSAELEELKTKLQELPDLPANVKDLQVQVQALESAMSLMETEKTELMENLIKLKEKHDTLVEEHKIALEEAEAAVEMDSAQDFQATIDALGFANEEMVNKNLKLLSERDSYADQAKSLGKKNQELMKTNADVNERLAELVKENKNLTKNLQKLQIEHNKTLAASADAVAEQENIKKELEDLQAEYDKALTNSTSTIEEQESIKKELEDLQAKYDKALADSTRTNKEHQAIKKELENALSQAETLQHQLIESKDSLHALQDFKSMTNGKTMPNEQSEVIASIAQELRQPMSSISGYTDLLISESVGILGALQKKFLERVKASTDRMHQLLNDLVQITTIDSGNFLFTLQPLELLDVIDLAIESTSAQFREKELSLRVDIHPGLPKMHTDKDALQQILLHLLHNAGAASPSEGEVTLKAHLYNKTKDDVILMSVSDSGEGIPKDELPRVFSRLYRADNPLIQGVGDTGVGLSIAKTLTEALGGRIWVESGQEKGATYTVLLPITSPALAQQEE